jgi:NADH:ubiquinone oxidoreductase subunit H
MDERFETPSAADIAGHVGALSAGLGILTVPLFPFAIPLIVLTIAPLAVLAVAGLLLALPILLPLWLARRVLAALRRRSQPVPVGATGLARHG